MSIFFMGLGLLFIVVSFYGKSNGNYSGVIYGIVVIIISSLSMISEREAKKVKTIKLKEIEKYYEFLTGIMEKEGISYSSTQELNTQLLDKYMINPFKLRIGYSNNTIFIIGDRSNSIKAYQWVGLQFPPFYRIPISNIRYYVQETDIKKRIMRHQSDDDYCIVESLNNKLISSESINELEVSKYTLLYFEDNGKIIMLPFEYDDYDKFKNLIPQKDYIYQEDRISNTEY